MHNIQLSLDLNNELVLKGADWIKSTPEILSMIMREISDWLHIIEYGEKLTGTELADRVFVTSMGRVLPKTLKLVDENQDLVYCSQNNQSVQVIGKPLTKRASHWIHFKPQVKPGELITRSDYMERFLQSSQ